MRKEKLQIVNPYQHVSLSVCNGEDCFDEWWAALAFVVRFVACIAIVALIMTVVLMILKYLEEFNNDRTVEDATTETNPLQTIKPTSSLTYGTMCDQYDCSTSYHQNCNTSSNYSQDLYDTKLCAICYDEERNSFFVPCGHCATCYDCAKRIFDGENKACPVCRRIIGKVRKLFAP